MRIRNEVSESKILSNEVAETMSLRPLDIFPFRTTSNGVTFYRADNWFKEYPFWKLTAEAHLKTAWRTIYSETPNRALIASIKEGIDVS